MHSCFLLSSLQHSNTVYSQKCHLVLITLHAPSVPMEIFPYQIHRGILQRRTLSLQRRNPHLTKYRWTLSQKSPAGFLGCQGVPICTHVNTPGRATSFCTETETFFPEQHQVWTRSAHTAGLLLHQQEKGRTAPGHLSTHQQVTDTQ